MAMPTNTETQKSKKATRSSRTRMRPSDPDREQSLDRTIESSFPASDAPSSIPDPEPKLPRNDGADDGPD
jgi:hypothetical protein